MSKKEKITNELNSLLIGLKFVYTKLEILENGVSANKKEVAELKKIMILCRDELNRIIINLDN